MAAAGNLLLSILFFFPLPFLPFPLCWEGKSSLEFNSLPPLSPFPPSLPSLEGDNFNRLDDERLTIYLFPLFLSPFLFEEDNEMRDWHGAIEIAKSLIPPFFPLFPTLCLPPLKKWRTIDYTFYSPFFSPPLPPLSLFFSLLKRKKVAANSSPPLSLSFPPLLF